MIIGVDEVNYSPSLVGDCVVCAFTHKDGMRRVKRVKDSKLLTHDQRLKLFEKLQYRSMYSVIPVTVNDINDQGIYYSRNLGITHAVIRLYARMGGVGMVHGKLDKIIVDGKFSEEWTEYFKFIWLFNRVECMVDGDQKVYEVSCASIIAKVYMDALFQGFGSFYPGYRMEINHGSPDKKMYQKIREDGPTPYHRVGYGKEWWKKIYKNETI